jgi:methionine biosynthesis protein MetW
MASGRFMRNYRQSYEAYWHGRQQTADHEQNDSLFPNEVFEVVDSLLKHGEKLLDIGCGNGSLIDITTEKFAEVHGCDISKTAIQEAKKRGIRAVCVDLNEVFLPYKSGSFDVIICLEVLDYVFDPLHLLCEIKRILRSKGQVILTVPNIRYFRHLAKLLLNGSFPHTTTDNFVWGGGHIHYFTTKDLSTLFKTAKFDQVIFHINQEQFKRSWKRRMIYRLIGDSIFKEWLCGGIVLKVSKP